MPSGGSRGCPPVLVSERSRQCTTFVLILISLLLCQMGLALLGLSFYVRPYLQQHHIVTGQSVDSDLFPYGLIAASVATLVSSCMSVMSGVSARQRRRSGRRVAVKFGYAYLLIEFITVIYLLSLGIVFLLQVDVFEEAYQRGFTRVMWEYMQVQVKKEYVDRVQQDFACCGSQGYSDWFVVDWYPRQLYQQRYKVAANQRNQMAKKVFLAKDKYPNSSALIESFSIGAYGTEAHYLQVVMAMDYEFKSGEFLAALLHVKSEVAFAEVPHSCCNPTAATWCHQMYATFPWYNYEPAKRLGVHHVGCTYKVKAFLSSTVAMLVAVLFCTMGVKCILMLLYRYVQTSMANALEAGRHLSPALGYLMPLPGAGGDTYADEDSAPGGDSEQQPLLSSDDGSETETAGTTDDDETEETEDQ
ncbi:uncharacterized protein LOC119096031 [Pollicipes pollicipes]|uniref:uncharacterized protein LOC119096031 n=1 Tax=Pollicipes pollicipes TaxID=41117 RepID=UPI001884FD54|nr:uncharacterized protein LOC119096031 [Pollicipes pollicipes]